VNTQQQKTAKWQKGTGSGRKEKAQHAAKTIPIGFGWTRAVVVRGID
jgi:hypothetical protein